MFTGKNLGLRTIQFVIAGLLLVIRLAALAQVTTGTERMNHFLGKPFEEINL